MLTIGRRGALALVVTFGMGFVAAAQAADVPHHRTYVDGPWGQIHVRIAGRDADPTVVLLHQMTWSSMQYRYAQDELALRGVRSIAIDIPGYGVSDGPKDLPTVAQYADAILPVLDAFKLDRATLLGTNTGATFISVLADRHPERVAHLILEGVPIWDAATRQKLADAPHYDQTPKFDGSQLMNRWKEIRDSAGEHLSLAAVQESIVQFFTAGPKEWYAHDVVFRTDLEPIVRRLKVPVTVLTYPGQELYQTSVGVKKMRPDFELVVLDDVGPSKVPSYDKPKPWAEAVAKIVKR